MNIQSIQRAIRTMLRGANHDFCPGLNRYVYWMKAPIGWVIGGASFSLLVGLFVGTQGFILMWAFLALLVLGVAWPWLSMKGLSCELHFEETRSQENHATQVILEVTNRLPLPAFGLMVTGQFLQDILGENDAVVIGLKRVPAWSVTRFNWTIEPKRRGQLPSDAPQFFTGFPFGMYNTSKPIEIEKRTIVWPACQDLDGVPELCGTQYSIEGTADSKPGNDGETIGLREYRYGDAIKNIHWSHTARCNRLIVRERQTLTQTPVRVYLDLHAQNHAGTGSQNSFECAIRTAASVCRQLHLHQAHIQLQCVGLPSGTPYQANNQKGLKPLLDFFAMLPSLEQCQEAAEPSRFIHNIDCEHAHAIIIHTKAFDPEVRSRSRIQRILIDSRGFVDSHDDFESPTPVTSQSELDHAAIHSPSLAAEQLGQIWSGSTGGSYAQR